VRGIAIDFPPGGSPVFDFSGPLVDFDTVVQDALINIGTTSGSDRIFGTQRGTTLKADGASGVLSVSSWAQNACNFASVEVLSFVQSTLSPGNPFQLQSLTLQCIGILPASGSAQLNASATSALGDARGVVFPIGGAQNALQSSESD
jgi:hypothetical protein